MHLIHLFYLPCRRKQLWVVLQLLPKNANNPFILFVPSVSTLWVVLQLLPKNANKHSNNIII